MKPDKMWKLLAAGLVFLTGGFLPLARGDAVNKTLLVLAALFILVAAKLALTRRRAVSEVAEHTSGRPSESA